MTNKLLRFVFLMMCVACLNPGYAASKGILKSNGDGVYEDTPVSIVWDFNTIDTYAEVTSVSEPDAISITSFNLGECSVTGVEDGSNVNVTFVKIQPKNDANDMVEWYVKPAKGVTFTPTHVSGYIQRFGTDAENGVTVSAKLADGTLETLGNYTAARNRKTQAEDKFGKNANYAQQFDITLTEEQQAKLASADGFTLVATVGVGNAKQGGFSDIHIDGKLNGSTRGPVFSNADATIAWAFESSSEDAPVVTPDGAFSLNTFSVGDNILEVAGKSSSVWGHFVGFKPKSKEAGASAGNAIEWKVVPAKGLTFTPLKVSGKLCRFGTNGGKMDVTVRTVEGVEKVLATGLIPPRDNKTTAEDQFGNDPKYTPAFEFELNDPTLITQSGFSLVINIYDLDNKEAGVSDIKILGSVDGEVLPVAKCNFEAVASPEDGGSVSVYPNGAVFDEGTELTLTATRNFGYKFVNWTDGEGKEVSTEAKFKYTVAADTKLTANFAAINTYSLDYAIEGGANYYMVQATPAPNVIDGKNMYEEGTEVTLTATSNPIITFSNWSDGQTSSSINFTMNENHSITATYSAIDFVVGWDFYRKGNNGRAADFYSADNDAAALILRNSEGNSEGWLDKSQESGGYEGRPGAVNWRTYGLGEYYWQTMVNASAFTNMKLITAMLYNYNAYTGQKVEYSLDGENWTLLGTINIEGNKNWTDAEFDLPAEANNQPALYIRWISDKESAIDGTTSNNDGIALGASYLIGTEKLIDDGTAPVLVSFVPEEGSETASINGRIVLTFDEKVKVTDKASATLNDQKLDVQVTGKTVLFQYKNLAYGTKYTFTLAANSISDLTDNAIGKEIVINFTTKTRPAVTKAMYDFVVPDDGSILEALDAAAKREDTSKRFRIFIKDKEGDYVIPAATDRFAEGTDGKQYPSATTIINVPNISIIGESMEGTSIINTVPEYKGGSHVLEGIGRGDVLQLTKQATGTYMQDVTIKSAMPDESGRNIVLNDASDKTVCKDVCLWAYQDTYVSNNENSRYYFEGGLLRGRTDFLCGKGDVYYNRVELQMCAGGYLAVPSVAKEYGYIFKDCKITGPESVDGQYTLGRPWGSGTPIALFIDTEMQIKPSAIGWHDMGTDGYPKQFAEYNSFTSNGSPIDLSQRKKTFGPGNHPNNPVLTKEEAESMTIAKVMGGDDDWDPAALAEQAPLPANVELEGSTLSWDDSEYVLCWAVCENGKVVAFTTEPEYTVANPDAVYSVRAANEMGGLGDAVTVGGTVSIDGVYTGLEVVSTIYYNLEGMRVSETYSGIVIRVDTLANGEVVTTKIMK